MGLLWADAGSLGQIVLQIGRGRQREIILHTGPLVRQPRLVHRLSQAAQGQGGVVDVLVLLLQRPENVIGVFQGGPGQVSDARLCSVGQEIGIEVGENQIDGTYFGRL